MTRIAAGIVFIPITKMDAEGADCIMKEFRKFVSDKRYPCVAARAAMHRDQISILVVDHMCCPNEDQDILQFIYRFISTYRKAKTGMHSAAVIFRQPQVTTLDSYEDMLWSRSQALAQLDALNFSYDPRVNANPEDRNFSFSLGGESFFIIGLHPASERDARRFSRPALIFNPHTQFEQMRIENRYEKMKKIVRDRDIRFSGSINPMLTDFGEKSEVFQYSGRRYDESWTCPLKTRDAGADDY